MLIALTGRSAPQSKAATAELRRALELHGALIARRYGVSQAPERRRSMQLRQPERTAERLSYNERLRTAVAADGSRTLEGLIPYNSRSADLGNFVEVIAPGAFADALTPGADVLCLRDHDAKILLGRTKSRTLTLTDSPQGLKYSVKLPKTTDAADLSESVARRDLGGCSFGFVCSDGGDTWTVGKDGVAVRTLRKVSLLEISPCSFPAYSASAVSVRSCPPEIRRLLTAPAKSSGPRRIHGRAKQGLKAWRRSVDARVEIAKRRCNTQKPN